MSRFLLVAFSLIAIAIAVAGAFLGFVRPEVLPLRFPAMVVFGLPYAAVLALFFSGRFRAYAFPLAAGSALVAILALSPYATMMLLFIGFAASYKDQLAIALALPAFVLAQVPLGIAALVAWWKLPAAERPARAWPTGIALPVAYAALAFGGYHWYEYERKAGLEQATANDAAAVVAIKRAVECLASHRDARGGFPASLDAVGPCLAGTVRNALAGYRVSYITGLPDSRGRAGLYSLCAEAERVGKTGWRTYVADEAGPGRADYPFYHESRKAPGCSGAWGTDVLRQVKHCVIAYAAKNPREGYPASLLLLGDHGNRCLTGLEGLTRLDANSASNSESDVVYRPGAPEGGRVARFELSTVVRNRNASYKMMIDETGTRYANERDWAKRGDPTPEEVQERITARERETRAETDALAQRCEQGSAADCTLLGFRRFEDERSDARALEAWRKACELKDREGCFFALSKDNDRDVFSLALSDKRDCERNRAEGCQRLARLVAHFEGCHREARPADCAEIAYRYARGGDTQRANKIWNAACEKRHKESCLLGKTKDFEYIRYFRLKDRCVTGEDAACSELAKVAEKAVRFE